MPVILPLLYPFSGWIASDPALGCWLEAPAAEDEDAAEEEEEEEEEAAAKRIADREKAVEMARKRKENQ